MPVETITDVPASDVDRVSRDFRVLSHATKLLQERQSNNRWTIRAEVPGATDAAPGMLVTGVRSQDRQA
jgi:hypothetical protein